MTSYFKLFLFNILILLKSNISFSQILKIVNLDYSIIETEIVNANNKDSILKLYNGIEKDNYYIHSTLRTFLLSDNRIIIELINKKGLIINNIDDFEKIKNIEFVYIKIPSLKNKLSYKYHGSLKNIDSFIKVKNLTLIDSTYEIEDKRTMNKLYKSDKGYYYEIQNLGKFNYWTFYPDLIVISYENSEDLVKYNDIDLNLDFGMIKAYELYNIDSIINNISINSILKKISYYEVFLNGQIIADISIKYNVHLFNELKINNGKNIIYIYKDSKNKFLVLENKIEEITEEIFINKLYAIQFCDNLFDLNSIIEYKIEKFKQ